MYSPSMPMQKIWMPPRKYMGSTVDVQPGIASCVKNLTHKAQSVTSILAMKIRKPARVIRRSGTTENEVTASRANAIILLNGYLDSPANRLVRS